MIVFTPKIEDIDIELCTNYSQFYPAQRIVPKHKICNFSI